MILNILGWELILAIPIYLYFKARIMATVAEINTNLAQLSSDLNAIPQPGPAPVATQDDLDAINASILALDQVAKTKAGLPQ